MSAEHRKWKRHVDTRASIAESFFHDRTFLVVRHPSTADLVSYSSLAFTFGPAQNSSEEVQASSSTIVIHTS